MKTHRFIGVAAALGLAFVPLVATLGSTTVSPQQSATQLPVADPTIGLPTKLPTGPPVTLPDPTTRKQARSNEVTGAVGAIVRDMPGFGGIWVDEAGLTHVAVQYGKACEVSKALGGRFKGDYVIEEAKFSYGDLVSRRNSISEQIGALKTQGLDLLEWGPDEKNNTVWISLRNYTAEKADSARTLLGADIIVKPAMAAGDANDLFSGPSG